MQKWLISADTKKWNHTELFARDGYIDWEKHLNYDVGDIVYIYAKKTKESDGKIMFKTFVEKIFPCLNDEGKEIECARLHLIQQVDKEELYLENLKKFYFIPPMKGFRFNGQLENYIDMYFDDDYDSNDIKNMWLIHEDEESQKKELFKNHNYVAGDWQVGDLSDLDYESVKSEFFKAYENFASPNAISKYSSQYNLFVNQINVGDYIISSNKSKKNISLANVFLIIIFLISQMKNLKTNANIIGMLNGYIALNGTIFLKKLETLFFMPKLLFKLKID